MMLGSILNQIISEADKLIDWSSLGDYWNLSFDLINLSSPHYSLPVMIIGCLFGWYQVENFIQSYHQVSDLSRGYLLGTGHALFTIGTHGYLVFHPNYARSQAAIPFYNWIYSASIAYFFLDLIHLFRYYRGKSSYYYSMLFHHLLGIISILLCYWTANFSQDDFNWELSLAFLSELSTPFLNYIQYHHGRVRQSLKIIFLVLYLCCRPILFTYLSWMGMKYYGWIDPHTICCSGFTGLNYYWFYKIVQKSNLKKSALTPDNGSRELR